MQREPKVFLEDILSSAIKVEKYTRGLSFEDFIDNDLVYDAVIKNILVIGEATKNIPKDIRQSNPHIEWRKMAGMRDMMIHGYFSINFQIIWDVVQNKIPEFKQQIEQLLSELDTNS
ncbi:HepT-like ribonuclease domain-containing protein [Heyndrickxia sp. NPDC080065]|uniref:HepT-like ribonuclease domain-containing protein n=1 Tax=Heyndrickxia sp. NPDC080065 TaxID=3390568 RepID=UPI003CFDA78F